jgi:tRNA (guanine37-N1)-methyltransferase
MRFDIITIFPEMFEGFRSGGIVNRAVAKGLVEVVVHDLRDFAAGRHRQVDDRPYGGDEGMVIKPEPVFAAVESVRASAAVPVVLLSPQGRVFDGRVAEELARHPQVVLICGRYEGIDERLLQREADEELAVGDFVVSGGELPALMLIDAIVRQRPGVLNDAESAAQDSFVAGLLDCPHYTRPEELGGDRVPEVLLSGHHAAIREWRLKQSLGRTWERRPELLEERGLTKKEQELLAEYRRERMLATDRGDAEESTGKVYEEPAAGRR